MVVGKDSLVWKMQQTTTPYVFPLNLLTFPDLRTKRKQLYITRNHQLHLIQVNRFWHIRIGDRIVANDINNLLYRTDLHLLHSTPHSPTSFPRLVRPFCSPIIDILQPTLQPCIHERSFLPLGEPLGMSWIRLAVKGLSYGKEQTPNKPITSEKSVKTV